jgi:hypothetical protein
MGQSESNDAAFQCDLSEHFDSTEAGGLFHLIQQLPHK